MKKIKYVVWTKAMSHHIDSMEYVQYESKLTPAQFQITKFLEVCIQILALHCTFIFESYVWLYKDGVGKVILD